MGTVLNGPGRVLEAQRSRSIDRRSNAVRLWAKVIGLVCLAGWLGCGSGEDGTDGNNTPAGGGTGGEAGSGGGAGGEAGGGTGGGASGVGGGGTGGTSVGGTGGTSIGGTGGTGAAGAGGEGGGHPVDLCGEGPLTQTCICGDRTHTTGWCCNGHWFDPYYEDILAGCPGSSAFRYLDPGHPSASDTGGGTEQAPWATIEHAVATTSAGQVLIVREGIYQVVCTGIRYDPALNPQSGTAGAPVILKAEGNVVIEPAVVASGLALGGSPSTIVLADSASSENNAYTRHHVRIVGGTGAGQARQIGRDFDNASAVSYEGATRTAWVSLFESGMGNWQTAPDTTSQYELVRNGPLIGTLDRQHVVWDGFHVRERDNYASDTGPIVLWGSQDVAILNSDLEGMTEMLYDNHNIVRIEGSTRAVVRNNRLFGLGFPFDAGPGNPQNHAAIMIYSSHDLVIENNEIFDTFTAIFPKGNGTGHEIRNNVVSDCAKAFRFSYHQDLRVYRNVVYGCEGGFQFAESISNISVFNNVVHEGDAGFHNWFAIEGASVFNNIFLDVTIPANFEGGVGTLLSNRNVYFNFTSFVPGSTFAGWQALGYDADSLVADPHFVDAAARNYHLATNSPAVIIGRDTGDIDEDGNTTETIPAGVYVSGNEVIGLFADR